jgi:hypothetical protein
MTRVSLISSAAAIGFAASTQAQANYQIIRWASGFCQVWDNSFGNKSFSNDYETGRKTFKTFGRVSAMRA